jgi:hypothetical protein
LAVKAQFSIYFHAFIPTGSPVSVKERNIDVLGNGFTGLLQKVMLLKAAVKQCRGKSVETFLLGELGHLVQSEIEANSASLGFSIDDLSEPLLHSVVDFIGQDVHTVILGVGVERVESAEIFRVRLNIGVEEYGCDFVACGPQILEGMDEARRATCMQKYFHEKGCLLSGVMICIFRKKGRLPKIVRD